jgi:SAM-dependent methyltransferase
MRAEPNAYSHRWFEFFHVGIGEARTIQETAFIGRCAPLPDFRNVLDVCCGMGRHARALSKHGYCVIGIDRDPDVIAKARALAGGPSYVNRDIRNYRLDHGACDVAIVMSQSFGYFDSTTNRQILEQLAVGVRDGGRVILDLWNPDFFSAHQGERELQGNGEVVRENKHVEGDRLFVQLDYPNGGQDQFEWQLFSPKQMDSMVESVGLTPLLACADFDETRSPSPTNPRVQFLFERRGVSPTNTSRS